MITIQGNSIVYGKIPFGVVPDFVAWCLRRGYDEIRRLTYYQPGTREFGAMWLDLAEEMPSSFPMWQFQFMQEGSR